MRCGLVTVMLSMSAALGMGCAAAPAPGPSSPSSSRTDAASQISDVRLICLAPATVQAAVGSDASDDRYFQAFIHYLASEPQTEQGMALARALFANGGTAALRSARAAAVDSGPCPIANFVEGTERQLADATLEPGHGVLSKWAIALVVGQRIAGVRDCYLTRQLAGLADARVVVRFVIGAAGPVESVEVEQTSDRALGECVAGVAGTFVFPAPTGNGRVIVHYPFVFSPAPN